MGATREAAVSAEESARRRSPSDPGRMTRRSAGSTRGRPSHVSGSSQDVAFAPRVRIAGAVLTPVRWVVLLGILASLHVRFGLKLDRIGLAVAVALYAGVAAVLPRLRIRALTRAASERLLLVADLVFCGVVFHLSGGMRSPYFGLCYLAMIHTALVLGPPVSLGVAAGAMAAVLTDALLFPVQPQTLLHLSVVVGKLTFLPLIAWAGGRLARELQEREVARRSAEQRMLKLEAAEERVRREMKMARHVQERLLPLPTPALPGLTLAMLSRPAQQIGGDIYDLIELPDGRLLIAVADVCGKGVPAALLTVAVQQGIRQYAGPDPAAVLAGVNRLLLENTPEDMFVTAVCVVLDPVRGDATAAAAGHPPPLWWDDARRRLARVGSRGTLLGLQPEWRGQTVQWQLGPGDALLLYTDGVLDAELDRKDRLGEERLAALMGGSPPADAQEWVDRLRQALDGCAALPDDVTAVAVVRAAG
jgi:serine phosphatase RsbU (regulator of sigma subunit)